MKLTMMMMSIMSMCWWRKNIISMLLSLELLMITLFYSLSSFMEQISMSSLLLMLVMMASGSSTGLSLLVSMSHSHFSSNSMNMLTLTFVKNYFNLDFINII